MTKVKKVKVGKVGKVEVKKVVEKKPYHLEIKVNDVCFIAKKAESLKDALTEFVESPDFPVGAKTTAFIKYSKGKNERNQIWQTPKARRLFNIIKLKPDYLAVVAEKMETELI